LLEVEQRTKNLDDVKFGTLTVTDMLWTLIAILIVLWLLGISVFHIAGGLIHILLVIAVIVLVIKLVGRRV
jgi:hypothetical protein